MLLQTGTVRSTPYALPALQTVQHQRTPRVVIFKIHVFFGSVMQTEQMWRHDPYSSSGVVVVHDIGDVTETDEAREDRVPRMCRDFLAGRCLRRTCAFFHPARELLPLPSEVCRDYCKDRCYRKSCMHFHGTPGQLRDMHRAAYAATLARERKWQQLDNIMGGRQSS